MSSPNQKAIFDPNQSNSSVNDSPLRSLTGMVMDKLNFCSSYVEQQLEFEMQQADDVMTSNFGYVEMAPKLFDEASVVESVTSRATSSVTNTSMERFSV